MPAPLSIVIPTLDVEACLPLSLAALMPGVEGGLVREVIVSDGGSADRTGEIAEATGAAFVNGSKGRGPQLKTGAEAARGEWLLFLHADSVLSPDWADRAAAHMSASPGKAAAFTLAYRSEASEARWLEKRANWRARHLGLPYGDQGLLISRRLYDEVGGFDPVPLMEDVKIIRRIGKRRLAILSARSQTSGEKYERDGWRKRAWRNAWLLTRFYLGADPEDLAKSYT